MARLQLDLSDSHDRLLVRLMELCDLSTKKDVVENALLLLGWAAGEAAKGLSIAAVDENRKVYKEVQTPALEGAKGSRERLPLKPAALADAQKRSASTSQMLEKILTEALNLKPKMNEQLEEMREFLKDANQPQFEATLGKIGTFFETLDIVDIKKEPKEPVKKVVEAKAKAALGSGG
jgi:hypothetical protein